MISAKQRRFVWYASDALIIAISVIGIVDTARHAGIPGQFQNQNDIAIGRDAGQYRAGDRIFEINGLPIRGSEAMFLELEGHKIGEQVHTVVERGDRTISIDTRLVPYYDTAFLILICFAALVFFCLALFVL